MLWALLVSALPLRATADGQSSLRMVLGAGKRFADAGDKAIFPVELRGDTMFGAARPRVFRLGPAFELRTVNFASLEAALGGGVSIPLPGDYRIGLNGLVGYAARRRAPDAPVAIGTLTCGYRGYNHDSWYGWGLNFFVSGRKDLDGEALAEITAGIEVDVMFTTVIPIFSIRNFIRARDPDEPSQPAARSVSE
jgi:hypothetical protein